MTIRARPVTRRRRNPFETEDRNQFLVTVGFILVVVLALLILGGAVAAGYYSDHFRPVARVNGTEISRDQWLDRQRVDDFRLRRSEGRIREAVAAGRLDPATAQQRLAEVSFQRENVASTAIEGLIDETLMRQLAPAEGVSVSAEEVEARIREEASTPEQRRVLAIFVEPEISDGADAPTDEQKQLARQRAQQALQELESGTDFATVAQEYSTDASRDRGGDYGYVDRENPTDAAWIEALFALPLNGTTGVVEGADGTFRIGRVAEIVPAVEDPNHLEEVEEFVSVAAYRQAIEGDVLEEKLRERIAAPAVEGDVEQVHAFEIFIESTAAPTVEGEPSPSPETEGQVRAAHILYSPNDDAQGAAALAEDDPAWAEAQALADQTASDLRAIADVAEREARFAEIAQAESDDATSGAEGGDLGFFSRGALVQEFGDAVFDGEHAKGDIIGPVRTQFGWHVIMFQARRPPASERVQQIAQQLRTENADFEAIAREHSDAANAAEGGDMGWIARFGVDKEVEDVLFALRPGQVSEPLELEDGYHIYKVTEREKRPLDPAERATIESNAFQAWYEPKKQAADITREDETLGTGVEVQ